MSTHTFETAWPVQAAKEQDLYFYLEETEGYAPHGYVQVAGHGEMLMLGGYSYLGLNGHPKINRAAQDAIEKYGTGTHGARLLAGTLDLHHQLEARIAAFKGTEAAAVFTSGLVTNISSISAMATRADTIIGDLYNHASIVDGCVLSGAQLLRFAHNDMESLEMCLQDPKVCGRKLVIVDGVFSMDGDVINLPEVSCLCKKYDALLMVDEAHAIGVLGATGHGIEEYFGLPDDAIDIKMGTLSKAIPSSGGYIAGSQNLCDFVKHQAKGFVYSGALPPASAAAALAAFDVIEAEPERIEALHANTEYFGGLLQEAGFNTLETATAIFPIVCGDDWKALEMARHCQKRGLYVQAILPPVVPRGKARLRAAVSAIHRREDLGRAVLILKESAEAVGGILR